MTYWSTVRADMKKFKSTRTVTNLLGRGAKCILPARTVRRMVKKIPKDHYWRVTGKSSILGSPSLHANRLFQKKAFQKSAWSLLNATETLTVFYGQMKRKLSVLATNRRVWHKKKDDYTEKNLIPTNRWLVLWRICDAGLFFLQRPWEPC